MVDPEEYPEKMKRVVETNGRVLDVEVKGMGLGLRKIVFCPQQIKWQLTNPSVKVNGCCKNTVEQNRYENQYKYLHGVQIDAEIDLGHVTTTRADSKTSLKTSRPNRLLSLSCIPAATFLCKLGTFDGRSVTK